MHWTIPRCLDCEAPYVRHEPTCACGAYRPEERRCLVCRGPIPSSAYRVDGLGREFHHSCLIALQAAGGDIVRVLGRFLDAPCPNQRVRHAEGVAS